MTDTGGFLSSRRVLISPISFRQADWQSGRFHVALAKAKVENSPSIDTEKPVSRRREEEYSRYYGYPVYWGSPGLWGMATYPIALASQAQRETPPEPSEDSADEAQEPRVGSHRSGEPRIRDPPV